MYTVFGRFFKSVFLGFSELVYNSSSQEMKNDAVSNIYYYYYYLESLLYILHILGTRFFTFSRRVLSYKENPIRMIASYICTKLK